MVSNQLSALQLSALSSQLSAISHQPSAYGLSQASSLCHHAVLMQSLMGNTTAVAHGVSPHDRAASLLDRCF